MHTTQLIQDGTGVINIQLEVVFRTLVCGSLPSDKLTHEALSQYRVVLLINLTIIRFFYHFFFANTPNSAVNFLTSHVKAIWEPVRPSKIGRYVNFYNGAITDRLPPCWPCGRYGWGGVVTLTNNMQSTLHKSLFYPQLYLSPITPPRVTWPPIMTSHRPTAFRTTYT